MSDVLTIAAGVALGNIFAVIFWLCARKADRYKDWSEVPGWTSIGFVVPLLFIAAVVFLTGPAAQ